MKNSEEKPMVMHKNQEGGDDQEHEEEEAWDKGCDWFGLFCLRRRRNDAAAVDEADSLLHATSSSSSSETWWRSQLKKLKQVSEKLAGPKWKNLLRKMGGYSNKQRNKNRFQYDPHSYALNFDNGNDANDDHQADNNDLLLHHNFSYAQRQ